MLTKEYEAKPFPLNVGDYIQVAHIRSPNDTIRTALCCVSGKMNISSPMYAGDAYYASECYPGALASAYLLTIKHDGQNAIVLYDPQLVPYISVGWKMIKSIIIEPIVDRSGATCLNCEEFYPYAQKLENGTYVCYLCRMNPYR